MDFEINQRILEVRKALKMSQTEFGKEIGVSRGVINNIDLNVVPAKPLLIQQICKAYNVNETWLTTGEGEMFIKQSRTDEIAQFVGRTLATTEDTFQKRLIAALSKLSVEEWEVLEKLANDLAAPKEKEQD
jgi:transcriptional regulator with XRE-family HTH domain